MSRYGVEATVTITLDAENAEEAGERAQELIKGLATPEIKVDHEIDDVYVPSDELDDDEPGDY